MEETKIARIGKVSSTDLENARVKVVFSDIDNMVTTDLPVLFPQGLKNKFYAMPDIGENVLCIFIEQGIGDGFCLGAFYTDSVAPPIADQDKVHYAFEDGTYIEYDRKEHRLKADIKGDADIKVKNVKVEAENVNTKCNTLIARSKEASITAIDVTLACSALTVNATGNISLKGNKVTLQGNKETQVVS